MDESITYLCLGGAFNCYYLFGPDFGKTRNSIPTATSSMHSYYSTNTVTTTCIKQNEQSNLFNVHVDNRCRTRI